MGHVKAASKFFQGHGKTVTNESDLGTRQASGLLGQSSQKPLRDLIQIDVWSPNIPDPNHRDMNQNDGESEPLVDKLVLRLSLQSRTHRHTFLGYCPGVTLGSGPQRDAGDDQEVSFLVEGYRDSQFAVVHRFPSNRIVPSLPLLLEFVLDRLVVPV